MCVGSEVELRGVDTDGVGGTANDSLLVVVEEPVGAADDDADLDHRASLILFGTALAGDWLLRQLGIGVPAFRIAGGLLLFLVATEMVLGVRNKSQTRQAEEALEEHVRNIAAFPLAIPLMAGPGAIGPVARYAMSASTSKPGAVTRPVP